MKTVNQKPLVTILICCYNGALYLDECLSSLVGQNTHEAFLVLFVNDASTDESLAIAQKYQEKIPGMTIINNPVNSGLVASCNAGLERIETPYYFRLDADDYLSIDAVKSLYAAIRTHADKDFIIFQRWDFDVSMRKVDSQEDIYMWIAANTLFKTAAVKAIGGYSKEYWEEYDLYLSLLENKYTYALYPSRTYYYRRGHASMTQNAQKKAEGFQSLMDKWGMAALSRHGDLKRILEYYDIQGGLNVKS